MLTYIQYHFTHNGEINNKTTIVHNLLCISTGHLYFLLEVKDVYVCECIESKLIRLEPKTIQSNVHVEVSNQTSLIYINLWHSYIHKMYD